MQIAVIGTGYVGLPTGVGFANLGHNVCCIDKDENKINKLIQGNSTLYEKDLDELLQKAIKDEKIKFTDNIKDGINNVDLIIVAVGTPQAINGKANLDYIYQVAKELKECDISKPTVIAIKSTVPIGTGDEFEKILDNKNCIIISLPEFLREGSAVYDFFNPDRIICGTSSELAKDLISKLYPKQNILFTHRRSAELIKYASNAFLAIKIHYINEIADLCEITGANVLDVAKGMGLDNRIGNKFLNPGIGYGGSCFPKDTNALYQMAKDYNVKLSLVENTISGNYKRITKFIHKISRIASPNKKIGILGLAFKNNTDDCRISPAMDIVKALIELGFELNVYDPKAMENAKNILKTSVQYCNNEYEVANKSDVLVILTEWEQFAKIDLSKIKCKTILDYRNILSKQEVENYNIYYEGVGI